MKSSTKIKMRPNHPRVKARSPPVTIRPTETSSTSIRGSKRLPNKNGTFGSRKFLGETVAAGPPALPFSPPTA
jgi:hypothetical protein